MVLSRQQMALLLAGGIVFLFLFFYPLPYKVNPQSSVSPTQGTPPFVLTFRLTGFTPNGQMSGTWTINNLTHNTGTTGGMVRSDGTLSVGLNIQTGTPPGTGTFTFTDLSSGLTTSVNFTVLS